MALYNIKTHMSHVIKMSIYSKCINDAEWGWSLDLISKDVKYPAD